MFQHINSALFEYHLYYCLIAHMEVLPLSDFGEKLKALRSEYGMTQAELAEKLNITKSVVSYYELQERTPSPDVLIQLARIFHVTTDYLLGVDNKRLIDVSDLSEDDIHFLLITIETLRKKNGEK